MNYYNIPFYVLSILFIVLFFRTFRKISLKKLYQNAKNRAKIDVKRNKAVEEGKIPFYFERGAVVIYAKTQARAIYDYREMKRNQKADLRTKKSK
jgi:hypothetical protein